MIIRLILNTRNEGVQRTKQEEEDTERPFFILEKIHTRFFFIIAKVQMRSFLQA